MDTLDSSPTAESLSDLLLPSTADRSKLIPYINRLTTLSISELNSEPVNLSSEAAVLATSLTTLCHNEYETFLSLRKTSSTINDSFDSFSRGIDSLLASIPELEEAAAEFSIKAKEIQDYRRETTLVLEQQDKLLDVVEIPQLVDTCVRNGYHQEALDLAAHSHRLAEYYPNVDLIQDVVAEVDLAVQYMVVQLFISLRRAMKLPALFKSINLLRRVGGLEPSELALAFLCARLTYLEGQLVSVIKDNDDAAMRLRRYIDLWREGANDIVVQFETIFLERESTPTKVEELRSLLISILHRLLDRFLAVLETQLPMIGEPNLLTSVLTQVNYCSISFAKIGMDFRPLLVPIFTTAVKHVCQDAVSATSTVFTSTIQAARTGRRLPSELISHPVDSVVDFPAVEITSPFMPPAVIATVSPHAQYTNGLINTLNLLRQVAPVSILEAALSIFEDSLARTGQCLLQYCRDWVSEQSSSVSENQVTTQRQALAYLCHVHNKAVIPFIRKAIIRGIFDEDADPIAVSAELAGVLLELQNWTSRESQIVTATNLDDPK